MLRFLVCILLVVGAHSASSCTENCKTGNLALINNRYENLVIAINPELQEDQALIDKIENIWTEASEYLWNATNNRAQFGNIKILVPHHWSRNSYNPARKETYESAHIVIAKENSAHGDSPYTMQYGQCGTMGEYIHLTPNFVLNDTVIQDYGPKGKAIVHEWAHLRWGVFDESPTIGSDPFYFDTNQVIQATRCPVSLEGSNVVIESDGQSKTCNYNGRTNWLPEEGCIFIPKVPQDSQKLQASLLSHQYLKEVVAFCHDDENDPINKHNSEAPNEHNRLCKQKSVWNIMLQSDDFAGTNNLPNPSIGFIKPNFVKIQQETPRFVLVLDTSGSMGGDRFTEMISAANLFVSEFVPIGSAVGIVEFSSTSHTESNMVQINSENERNELIHVLNNVKLPNGGTCIGCGILQAIHILENSIFSLPGSHIVVLTDGEETTCPCIRDLEEDACRKSIVVDSIFFGPTVNAHLGNISSKTCGEVMPNGLDDLQALIESFKGLSEAKDGDVHKKVLQIYGESYQMTPSDIVKGEVPMDSTVGKNTVFTITWSQYNYPPSVTIINPNGTKYCSHLATCSSDIVTTDMENKIVKYTIPGIAQAGSWFYEIRSSAHSQQVNIMVTSMAANQSVDPIMVKSTMSSTDISTGQFIVVNAKVTQGYLPITGAVVEATITSTKDGAVTDLPLFDNGAAPDVRRNDGVYSRYFTGFTASGRYSVKVKVAGLGSNSSSQGTQGSPAAFNYGHVDADGKVVLNPRALEKLSSEGQTGTSAQDIDPFKRVDSAGGFSYSGPPSVPSNDKFPPSQVIDLVVRQIDPLNAKNGVSLNFTAPGDDYDEGTADSYEIRYTYDNPSILTSSFTSAIEVPAGNMMVGDLSRPSVANTIEAFQINLTDIPTDKDLVTVAFALRAVDDIGNIADVSNIAMMNLFLKPPPVACSDENGYPTSTDPFEKPGDCFHFYQCANGELNTLPCLNDTVFNPDIGTCDHPINVEGCGKPIGRGDDNDTNVVPPPPPSPPSPVVPTCVDETGRGQTTLPISKEGDCTHFYQCSNGVLYEFACPAGLAFNPQLLYCDWPQNVPGC